MYTMDQIHNIRQLFFEQGMNLTDIAKTAKCNWRTARKYVDMEDFSSSVPVPQGKNSESKLDPFKPLIDKWLLADKKAPRRQRHTAKRIYNRLRNETKGFRCSYRLVADYVSAKKKEMRLDKHENYIPLLHRPGEAQADFGNADFIENGKYHEKGKVERLVRYVKESFIPGRIFSSVNDLNAQALAWCAHVNSKEHGTTGKIPAEELPLEKLKALPPQEIIDNYRYEDRHVQRDGFVSYDGILYGVPCQYSGRYVKVRQYGGAIEIYYNSALIASHKIPEDRSKVVFLPGQYRGFTEYKEKIQHIQCAYKCPYEVEARSLMFYEQITEDRCYAGR